ncbi:MAG: hypothetical protein JW844_00210 [Candidatus Omnitrophica bacterium]|nr:hypothetical protein [Candidatus Omnitrophota bacterium]
MALIVFVFIMMVLGALGAVLASLISNQMTTAIDGLNTTRAFYAAEGGLEWILEREFRTDSDFSDNVPPTDAPFGISSVSLAGGECWFEYANQDSANVDITVTARVGESVRVVQQHLAISVPATFGSVQFATGSIHLSNSTGNVAGDITAVGEVNLGVGVTVLGDVTPGSPLEIPELDFSEYEAMTNETVTGNCIFEEDASGYILVEGSVTLEAGVAFTGILYARGNITVEKDVTVEGALITEANLTTSGQKQNLSVTAGLSPTGSQLPAMAVGGNVTLSGYDGLTIHGLVYALGNINMSNISDLEFSGAMVTDQHINMNNADEINLTYDAALVQDIPGFQEAGETALVITEWREL